MFGFSPLYLLSSPSSGMKYKGGSIYIIIVLILFLFIIIVFNTYINVFEEAFIPNENNNWVVLLTTCVMPNMRTEDEIKMRKKIYVQQINRWLNETNLPIFVVESSGYTFDEIPQNERLHIFSFTINKPLQSSTEGEKISMEYALQEMQKYKVYQNCSHILKVTGRYYLDGIENMLNNMDNHSELYLQIHRVDTWQNSEYFGIKKELMSDFLETIEQQLMEQALYNYSSSHTFETIGPFENKIARGGAGIVINPL